MITEASVKWTDGDQFIGVPSSGHGVVIDADRNRNSGAGPMELLILGLGGCTGTDVISILKKKRERVTGLEIKIRGERAPTPPTVYTQIHVHYIVSGMGIKEKSVHDAIQLSETKYCGAAAMLGKTATISFDYEILEIDPASMENSEPLPAQHENK
ncbi:MAG: OsmC family protein [Acidobacteriia bacterium]|nr:OsmC family protein [Terriglobia bacterium]